MRIFLASVLILCFIPGIYAREYTIPRKFSLEQQGAPDLDFYPIGWSKDGNFAYILYYTPGRSPYGYYDFIIQSAVTDEILYIKTIYGFDEKILKKQKTIAALWKEYYTHFKRMLLSYKITEDFSPEGGRTNTFIYKDSTYVFTVHHQKSQKSSGVISAASLVISSNNLGKKTVFSFTAQHDKILTHSYCSGYIKSPYEERILIIYIEIYKEHTKLRLIGAHLETGYRK